jgi:hypothetical protein
MRSSVDEFFSSHIFWNVKIELFQDWKIKKQEKIPCPLFEN